LSLLPEFSRHSKGGLPTHTHSVGTIGGEAIQALDVRKPERTEQSGREALPTLCMALSVTWVRYLVK
jgi:hypothetical protein